MKGKFLITYTICSENKKALNKLSVIVEEYGFESQNDQSTYLGGEGISLKDLEDRLVEVKVCLNPKEEHITLYYASDNMILKSK